MSEQEKQLSGMDSAMEQLDRTFSDVEARRGNLIKKLESIVNQMTVSPGEESPRTTEIKIGIINALDSLLKSSESNAMNRAKTIMQKKDTESSDATKQLVINILSKINPQDIHAPNTSVTIPTDIDAQISNAIEQTNHPIEQTELETNEGDAESC